MSLSKKTVHDIADALKKDVIDHIFASEGYASMMQQLVCEALDATMGEMDDDLYFDLAMVLFDSIDLK